MEYRKLGRTGLKVSELCIGSMNFGWTASEQDAYAVFSAFADAGGNFIDTADIYSRWVEGNPGGIAETYIGNWLQGRTRHEFVIATKVRGRMGEGPNDEGLSRAHLAQSIEASLKRLQTDYIDLYYAHWPDDDTLIEETLRTLDDLVKSGKVRYVGASNYSTFKLTKALWTSDKHNLVRFDCLQPHYNMVHRAEFERDLQEVCLAEGLGVVPYSPLAGGFLTGKYQRDIIPAQSRGAGNNRMQRYMVDANFALLKKLQELGQHRGKTVAQMALGWLLSNPVVTSPIIGANSVKQLEESLGAVDLRLEQDEMDVLNDLSKWE